MPAASETLPTLERRLCRPHARHLRGRVADLGSWPRWASASAGTSGVCTRVLVVNPTPALAMVER